MIFVAKFKILHSSARHQSNSEVKGRSSLQEGGGGGGGGWDKIIRNVGINALFLCGYFLIDGGGGFFGGGGGGGMQLFVNACRCLLYSQ